MAYCPICHEEMDFGGYDCLECGRNMCEDCFGDPVWEICWECRKKEKQDGLQP